MRTLKFIVKGQILEPDPSCDFSGLVPGSEGYLQADFAFSKDWDGCAKVVGFKNTFNGQEYPPRKLKDGRTCIIPAEALKRKQFKMWVIGKGNDIKLTTNKIVINQTGGKV